MSSRTNDYSTLGAYLLIAVLVTLVYWPGLGGGFAFDDYHVIVNNDALVVDTLALGDLLDAAFSTATGPLKRPLVLTSFAFDRAVSGLDPAAFKRSNLLIHCINAALLFVLMRRLLVGDAPLGRSGGNILAPLIVLAWAVHPINLSAVLYIVQRMTLLSATFMLAGILAYVEIRIRQRAGRAVRRAWWVCIVACVILGLASKETAVLLPVYIAVVELLVFRTPKWQRPAASTSLWIGLAAVLGLLALALAWDGLTHGYRGRDFTLGERLLTESRVVFAYLQMLIVPDLSKFGLFHDDLVVSKRLLEPVTTLAALLGVAIAVAVVLRGRPRILALGVAWFLGGHLLESTFLPLELMHEHRNYLPSVGIVIALVVYLDQAACRWLAPRARYLPTITIIAGLAGLTALRANDWADPWSQLAVEAHHHPQSSRTLYEFGRLSVERASASGDAALSAVGLDAIERSARLSTKPFMAYAALLKLASNRADEERVREIIDDVAAHPSPKVKVDVLQQVISCQAFGSCRADPQTVFDLAGSALDEARVPAWRRRYALEWLAIYYLRVLGDSAAGISILRDLVRDRPSDPQLSLRLAEALNANGERAEARAIGRDIAATLPWYAGISDRPLTVRLTRLLDGATSP